MQKRRVNRWQSRGGKYWLELYHDELGYTFRTESGGGSLGNITPAQVLTEMDRRIRESSPKLHLVELPVNATASD